MRHLCILLFNLVVASMLSAAEPMAFLGVATRGGLAESQGLPAGVGLTVMEVVPDSPAAGVLERGDVLHRLGDQLLINPEQLSVLVGLKAPGDEVELVWRRNGEEKEARFVLAERPMQAARSPSVTPAAPRRLFPVHPSAPWPGMKGFEDRFRAMEEEMEAMQQRLQSMPSSGSGRMIQHQRTEWRENDTRVVIETRGDGVSVRVEQGGETLFSGPVDSDQDLSKIPGPIKEKVQERLQAMGIALGTRL